MKLMTRKVIPKMKKMNYLKKVIKTPKITKVNLQERILPNPTQISKSNPKKI